MKYSNNLYNLANNLKNTLGVTYNTYCLTTGGTVDDTNTLHFLDVANAVVQDSRVDLPLLVNFYTYTVDDGQFNYPSTTWVCDLLLKHNIDGN